MVFEYDVQYRSMCEDMAGMGRVGVGHILGLSGLFWGLGPGGTLDDSIHTNMRLGGVLD